MTGALSGVHAFLGRKDFSSHGGEETVKKKTIVLVALALLAGLVLPSTAAATRSPQLDPRWANAAGVWSWTEGEFIADDLVGDRQYFHGHEHGTWTGTFEGTAFEPFFGYMFGTGRLWAVIMIDFTGTANGVSGEALIRLIVTADPVGNMGGTWKVVRGTGGLRHLRGHGTWVYTGDSADGLTSYADYSGVFRLP